MVGSWGRVLFACTFVACGRSDLDPLTDAPPRPFPTPDAPRDAGFVPPGVDRIEVLELCPERDGVAGGSGVLRVRLAIPPDPATVDDDAVVLECDRARQAGRARVVERDLVFAPSAPLRDGASCEARLSPRLRDAAGNMPVARWSFVVDRSVDHAFQQRPISGLSRPWTRAGLGAPTEDGGLVVVLTDDAGNLAVARSTDGGRSFVESAPVGLPRAWRTGRMPRGAFTESGAVYAVQNPARGPEVVTWMDGVPQRTFALADTGSNAVIDEVDVSARGDDAVVTWTQQCPGENRPECQLGMMMRRTRNGGRTWEPARAVARGLTYGTRLFSQSGRFLHTASDLVSEDLWIREVGGRDVSGPYRWTTYPFELQVGAGGHVLVHASTAVSRIAMLVAPTGALLRPLEHTDARLLAVDPSGALVGLDVAPSREGVPQVVLRRSDRSGAFVPLGTAAVVDPGPLARTPGEMLAPAEGRILVALDGGAVPPLLRLEREPACTP